MAASKRQKLRQWIFTTYGDGTKAPCDVCGIELDQETMTIDRFPVAGAFGGTYCHVNVRPLCFNCNQEDGREIDRLLTGRSYGKLSNRGVGMTYSLADHMRVQSRA